MYLTKKAFSFVELIISISILILLAVIGVTMYNGTSQKTSNAKVETDISTLKNAFIAYGEENKTFPTPDGNNNYFAGDSTYSHSGSTTAFGVYGSVTEQTLPKKYLDNLPLDPISNHYYAYGKTLNNKYFEIAGVLRIDEKAETKLDGNYPGEYGPITLIREYNGGFFISDKSTTHLPYNPDEHILTVTDQNGKVYRKGDTITTTGSTLNLYFSDGSVSTLGTGSTLILSDIDFKTPENNLLTKIKIFLQAGSIFTKATALNSDSDFEIYTADTAAAVRGTVFLMKSDGTVTVFEGSVDVYDVTSDENNLGDIANNEGRIITGSTDDYSNYDQTKEPIEANLPVGKNCKLVDGLVLCNGEYADCEFEVKYQTPGLKSECLDGQQIDQMPIYAYAPYNNKNNITISNINSEFLNLYLNTLTSKEAESYFDNWQTLDSFTPNEMINRDAIQTVGDITGVFVNNVDTDDYIKYSNLNLTGDFAIEMSVETNTITTSGNRYFFDGSGGNGLKIMFSSPLYNSIKINNELVCTNCIPTNLTETFTKITLINGKSLQIGNKIIPLNETNKINELNDLYIGSSSANPPSLQINGIINYVKIYK